MAAITKLGRYREISPLGSGGMATVMLAEDMTLGRLVALKRVHALGDARGGSRLRREALVGASFSHPNLVSIYDVVAGEDGEQVIVMEYVAGETLRERLRRGSRLPVAEALRIIGGVSAALDAIHRRGIVHRDVKPANILLGVNAAIKLADLGIASAADRTRITTDGDVLGTFSYMAPEQLGGAPPTAAVDVYALSAVAFELLSGRKARLEPNPLALAHAISTQPPPDLREVWPQAPRAAVELLDRGMSREPSRRPGSAGELAGRLRAALEPRTTAPMPTPAGVFPRTRSPAAPASTSRRGSGPAPEPPRQPPRPSDEENVAAAAGVAREKRPGGGGGASLRDRRAQSGRAQRSPAGSAQPSGRREGAAPPVIAAGVPASSARRSGAVIAAAPNATERPPTERAVRGGGPMLANAGPVASRRRGRSRGGILAAVSIALVALAVVVVVAISGGSPRPHTPSGATASRRSSSVPSRSRTTAKTNQPLTGPANRTTTTGASSPPASGAAATGASSPPASGAAATGASSPPASGAAATGASSSPASPSATPSASAAGSPVSAVELFYALAASHRYAEAWALADPTFRTQLGGYHSFQAGQAGDRSITFGAARVVSRSSADATVSIRTTSVRTDGTQHCLGTVDLVSGRASGGWLLHLIHINCT